MAHAQDVRWERVGEPFSARALDFTADGTLYAAGSVGLVRLTPEETWEVLYDDPILDLAVLAAGGVLVVVESFNILRSADGGQTWEEVHGENGELERLEDGTLFCGRSGLYTGFTVRSDDGGATWEEPVFSSSSPLHCGAFGAAATPPRVLAGCVWGVAKSDDGGLMFEPSSLWEEGTYVGYSFARLADGTVFALVGGGCCYGGVYRSTDGGQTWGLLLDVGRSSYLAAASETAFVVRPEGMVWRLEDGGGTWEELPMIYEGEDTFVVNDAEAGPDGRLYVAARGDVYSRAKGVWRTVEPVFPVAAETVPPQRVGTLLEVYPNPAGEAITVALTLTQPGVARVAVYDVLGREVAVLADRVLEAGRHALPLTGGALPSGTYVVRAEVTEAGGIVRILTQKLVLAR